MPLSRRQFLKLGAQTGLALALGPVGCRLASNQRPTSARGVAPGVLVNDVHSQLNLTRVRQIARPASLEELRALVRGAAKDGVALSFAGGRHSAGGQQFLTNGLLVDMRGMNRVLDLDVEKGIVTAEAGIQWPELMEELARRQSDPAKAWGIVQKQGMDRMTLGGSLGSNIHGNGLGHPPIVAQIDAFNLIDASGKVRTCSRRENPQLFSLAVGGYGLFGPVSSIRLRLARRRKLRANVSMANLADVPGAIQQRQASGAMYGDWHYLPDPASKDFLRRGVLATYHPLVDGDDAPVNEAPAITAADWLGLVTLAHINRGEAYARFAAIAVQGNGAVVWSDTFQLDRVYADDYHQIVDHQLKAPVPASESLVEFFVPRAQLVNFMEDVRADFLHHQVDLLYGTVRFVERDAETFLPWAQQSCACIVFNFHVIHDEAGRRTLAETFRRVVDIAERHHGTFYLTYHRFATRSQLERCHPRLAGLLHWKRQHDPRELFQSDWYRHHRALLGGDKT